jgi:hypothetical protein
MATLFDEQRKNRSTWNDGRTFKKYMQSPRPFVAYFLKGDYGSAFALRVQLLQQTLKAVVCIEMRWITMLDA